LKVLPAVAPPLEPSPATRVSSRTSLSTMATNTRRGGGELGAHGAADRAARIILARIPKTASLLRNPFAPQAK
jgi:hypothetical protein